MKKSLSILLISFMFILFTGCASKETKIVYITKTKTRFNFLPERYYKDDIALPKPPDKKTYLLANPIERTNLDTNLILELYKTVGLYKIKLKAIRDYELQLRQGTNKLLKSEEHTTTK